VVQPCRDYASEKGLGKGEGADLLGIRCRGHLAPCNAIRRCPSEQFIQHASQRIVNGWPMRWK
jgi:hypothetical protein